jgi:hypothetical protein
MALVLAMNSATRLRLVTHDAARGIAPADGEIEAAAALLGERAEK